MTTELHETTDRWSLPRAEHLPTVRGYELPRPPSPWVALAWGFSLAVLVSWWVVR